MASLRSLGLLDTPPEERFDRITRLAQRLFGVQTALVSLVDEDRQWFKSRQGLEAVETPRAISFCGHAILGEDTMHVADASADARFADNPLVTGAPHIRFYAGHPITAPDGSKIGTLCVIDERPRQMLDGDLIALRELAEMVEHEVATFHLSIADELTGLSNRRGFFVLGEKVLELCVRQSMPASLVFADIDNLKPVNDTLGHHEGDRVIRETGRAVATAFRSSDVIARIGGDEFAVLITDTDHPAPPVERLREALAQRNGTVGLPGPLSISIGVAAFDPAAPVTLGELLAQADIEMYTEKNGKRSSP